MDNETDRLARRVAEAADAWMRDPLDAHVYQRLVAATLDWRTFAQHDAPHTPHTPESPESPAAVDDPDVAPPDDPGAVPPERRPQRLDLLLGPVADELRARTGQQPT